VRDVEAIVSPEAEEQVVARHLGDLAGLEAEELADAVILVDELVLGLGQAAGGDGRSLRLERERLA
jgi:hypothetical protein